MEFPEKIRVLHITPSSNGYEEVWLLANRVTRRNHLAVIEDDKGEVSYTGGIILDLKVKPVLDMLEGEEQYEFIQGFRKTPFVKDYYIK
jgi:hypothetical protein